MFSRYRCVLSQKQFQPLPVCCLQLRGRKRAPVRVSYVVSAAAHRSSSPLPSPLNPSSPLPLVVGSLIDGPAPTAGELFPLVDGTGVFFSLGRRPFENLPLQERPFHATRRLFLPCWSELLERNPFPTTSYHFSRFVQHATRPLWSSPPSPQRGSPVEPPSLFFLLPLFSILRSFFFFGEFLFFQRRVAWTSPRLESGWSMRL